MVVEEVDKIEIMETEETGEMEETETVVEVAIVQTITLEVKSSSFLGELAAPLSLKDKEILSVETMA